MFPGKRLAGLPNAEQEDEPAAQQPLLVWWRAVQRVLINGFRSLAPKDLRVCGSRIQLFEPI